MFTVNSPLRLFILCFLGAFVFVVSVARAGELRSAFVEAPDEVATSAGFGIAVGADDGGGSPYPVHAALRVGTMYVGGVKGDGCVGGC